MTIDEASRLHLYEQARSTWGAEAADTLMNAIPTDPDRLATRDDVTLLRSELRGEMAELRGEMAELRGEMAELRGEMAELRSELRGEIATASGETIRTIVFAMLATNATLVGLVFAAVRLA